MLQQAVVADSFQVPQEEQVVLVNTEVLVEQEMLVDILHPKVRMAVQVVFIQALVNQAAVVAEAVLQEAVVVMLQEEMVLQEVLELTGILLIQVLQIQVFTPVVAEAVEVVTLLLQADQVDLVVDNQAPDKVVVEDLLVQIPAVAVVVVQETVVDQVVQVL
jgi:hypothetical protein